MGRWTPPPTQDPLEQAQRETCETRELLAEASAEIDAMRAQLRDLQAIVASAQHDKNSAVRYVKETLIEEQTKRFDAVKRAAAWESIAWNLLNIGFRYITESQDRRDFSDQFERLQAHYLVRRQ